MKKSQRIVSLVILFASLVVVVNAQTQRPTYLINDGRVGVILQKLERNSSRFRNSLNLTLIGARIDQTRAENDINTFEPDLEQAINGFKDRFAGGLASTADVQNVLLKAALINGFMARNRLSQKVQTEWVSVRNDLSALATVYGVSWQWNRRQSPAINSPQLTRLSESDLNQLISRIEVAVDTFTASIGVAFDQSRYDRTRSEGSMNDAVLGFQKATNQLRNHFDAREVVSEDIVSVLQKATPLDRFMSDNLVTERAQRDWLTLRRELDTLGNAYEVRRNWDSTGSF